MKQIIRNIAVFLVTVIAVTVFNTGFISAGAEELKTTDLTEAFIADGGYADYLKKYSDFNNATEEIIFRADIAKFAENVSLYGEEAVICKPDSQPLLFSINIPTDGLYSISVDAAFPNGSKFSDFSLKIDGSYPFKAAKKITLNAIWENTGEVRTDGGGNEITPEQRVAEIFTKHTLKQSDSDRYYVFAFTAGEHTLELQDFSREIAFSSFTLGKPSTDISYSDYISQLKDEKHKSYNGKNIIIEGEDADYKSEKNLIPLSDNSSPEVSPSSAVKSLINYIGSSNWSVTGQRLTWKFEIKESGYYKLGFKYRQSGVTNGNVYRTLYIDDKVPFAEAYTLSFGYDTNWQFKNLGDAEKDFNIYLEQGEHTLSLEVTLGELQPYIDRLNKVTERVGSLYRRIVMITGETVDANRDYNLFEQIPDFEKELKYCSKELNDIAENIRSVSGEKSGSNVSALFNMSRVLTEMTENPYTAHRYKNTYYSNYCSLASFQYELTEAPLDIDYLILSAPERETEYKKSNFFQKIGYSFLRLINSYIADYSNISGSEEEAQLTIWVNWGRDQARVLNSLIQSDFTPNSGIGVNVRLTNATLIQGILSGNGPDCSLHLARSEPVNLAMRNALYDLSSFKDYDDVMKRFLKGADTAYTYQGGKYALPDTETFYMMFCRTDILKELGVKIPTTWDEFEEAGAIIQRNNFQVNVGGGVAGSGSNMSIFATMLAQNGGGFYKSDLKSTNLTSETALNVFSKLCSYYTDYKVPITADFYNRFRTGLMPLGIQPYTMYLTLAVAAPEIKGKWCMVPIPGVENSDGTVNNIQMASGTGCSILKTSNNKKEAWEFLKWWTEADTQLAYSENVESIIGTAGRVATATVEALSQMSWQGNDYESLCMQMETLSDLPELPGGYYMTRVIDQAFYNAVSNGENPKDMLLKWSKIADAEIKRKSKQYGIY